MLYRLLRHLLFLLPTEASHTLALRTLKLAHQTGLLSLLLPSPVHNPHQLFGLEFPNPVGLAAGLDKNGDYIDALGALGFGFIEIGTVTPRPQPGNPKPRLFRLPAEEAIINRMGFNNKGVEHLLNQVRQRKYPGILGINIGKNFDTPVENALRDYLICMEKVYPVADYITVNLSSPNTPGLRSLQFGESLRQLLTGLVARQNQLQDASGRKVPLLVKIAPDMNDEELEEVAGILIETGVDGVIATNTTISREAVKHLPHGNEAGGLSGKPVEAAATAIITRLAILLDGKLPVIGVGGIRSAEGGEAKITAGASLLQVYTGFIYQGPGLVRQLARLSIERSKH